MARVPLGFGSQRYVALIVGEAGWRRAYGAIGAERQALNWGGQLWCSDGERRCGCGLFGH